MRPGAGALVALLLLAAACGDDAGWSPVLEPPVPTVLESELGQVAESLRQARAEAEGCGTAVEGLEDAERRLSSLTGIYLPLFRARIDAANAYRYHSMGREGVVSAALMRVDSAVAQASRATGGSLESELEEVASWVARSRVALEGDSPEAPDHLRRLAETLSDLVTRASLIL